MNIVVIGPFYPYRGGISDTNKELCELLIDNVYVPNNTDDRINQINRGITLCYDSDILLKSKNIDIDKTKIAMANELRKKIIKVDEYNEKFH